MFTPQEPSDTLLVLAPLQPDGGVARWQLTYVNSVGQTAAAKSPFGNGKTFEDEQVLMVVPFPNRGGLGEKDVILSAVFPHQVPKMRSSARAAFTPFTPEVPKAAPFGAARGWADSARRRSMHHRSKCRPSATTRFPSPPTSTSS